MPAIAAAAEQLGDRLGEVVGRGRRAELVGDEAERLAGRPGPVGGGEDLGREVVAGRPEQPRRPDDPERRAAPAPSPPPPRR